MSEPLLKSRNVFVDTEAYEHQKFRFDHPVLKKLKDLGSVGFLHLLTTSSVDREVRQHISNNLNNAFVSLTRFQNHAGVLQAASSEECRSLFKTVDQSALIEFGMEVWEKFLADSKVEVVNASNVHTPDLLNLYFAQRPPFSKKKKSEFPDAISLLSLEQWCRNKGEQLFLISGDPDLKAWCDERPGMHHVKSLNEFLDLYNRAEENLTQLAHAIFDKEQEWVDCVLKDEFLGCSFVYANNWEAEVENVEITSTRIDDVNVIEVDEYRFILSLQMEISFTADVSGPDYDRGWWDSEEKSYMHLPSFHAEVSSTDIYDVSFEVIYDISKEEATEIKEIMFNDGRQITVRDEHGWPYK